jgi:hypothetical protein
VAGILSIRRPRLALRATRAPRGRQDYFATANSCHPLISILHGDGRDGQPGDAPTIAPWSSARYALPTPTHLPHPPTPTPDSTGLDCLGRQARSIRRGTQDRTACFLTATGRRSGASRVCRPRGWRGSLEPFRPRAPLGPWASLPARGRHVPPTAMSPSRNRVVAHLTGLAHFCSHEYSDAGPGSRPRPHPTHLPRPLPGPIRQPCRRHTHGSAP